jgi:hypothetical protein
MMEAVQTSEGQGSADGMKGTMKSLDAKESLQKVNNHQIQAPHELFNYCSSYVHNITFFYIQEEQILNYKIEVVD